MLWGIRLPGIPDTTYTEVWRNNSKYEDLQHTGRNNKRTTPSGTIPERRQQYCLAHRPEQQEKDNVPHSSWSSEKQHDE